MLARLFGFDRHGTTLATEVRAGLTTFLTMGYIIVVNPAILAAAGIPVGPSTTATILVAGLGSILMGVVANRPIGVAPYMGENAFIAFGLAALGIGWQMRLGAVFLSGVIFLVITLLRIRGWLANAISPSMKYALAVGIGLFLSFIGLVETGIVKPWVVGKPPAALFPRFLNLPCDCLNPIPAAGVAVPLEIGDLASGPVLLAILGLIVIAVFMAREVRSAILLGVFTTGVIGLLLGYGQMPEAIVALPRFTGPDGLFTIAGKLRFSETVTLADGTTRQLSFFSFPLLPVLLTLFLMDFLDTLGTLVGVGAAGNMLDKDGNFPRIERPMIADAVACIFSALIGTSTSGAYIESATGIKDGGRTGMTAIVTGLLFLACLFFVPLVTPLQSLKFAYGPALIVVGILMIKSIVQIRFDDLTEVVPAFATITIMVFTYNIANGLTAGLVLYPLLKVAAGRGRELNLGMIVMALLCLSYYLFGMVH